MSDDERTAKRMRRSNSAINATFHPNLGPRLRIPPFAQPATLATFSFNEKRGLFHDNRSLKYFVPPVTGQAANVDLTKNFHSLEQRDESVLEHLDALCFSLQNMDDNERQIHRRKASLVTWRGMMTRFLTMATERDPWKMRLQLEDGTLYIEDDESQKISRPPQNKHSQLLAYTGYAFESYCTMQMPPHHASQDEYNNRIQMNGWSGDVNTNVQWCGVVRTKLGSRRIIIGGEVDCLRAENESSRLSLVKSNGLPQPSLFHELKTSAVITNENAERNFDRKLNRIWAQSFLLGVPQITVGFRTKHHTLSHIWTLDTLKIPKLVREGKPKPEWDSSICLAMANDVLEWIFAQVSPGGMDVLLPSQIAVLSFSPARDNYPMSLSLSINPADDSGLKIPDEKQDTEPLNIKRTGFLPSSFVDWVREERQKAGVEKWP